MNPTATLIGDDFRVEGLVEGEGDIVIAGYVQGVIRITGVLTVARSGIVIADVNAHDVIVDGNLEGDVRVVGAVRIGPHGSVLGNVHGRLEIAHGGSHRGSVKTPRPTARTDYSARLPQDRDTVPSAASPPAVAPGAKKRPLEPQPSLSGDHPPLEFYGRAGRPRGSDPRAPQDFAITTGEPEAVDSGDHPSISSGPMPPPAWMLEGSELDDIETTPGMRAAPAPSGPLRLTAEDLVTDAEEPPARASNPAAIGAIRLPAPAPGLVVPDDDEPSVRVNVITDPGSDPADLPRGRTALLIPNPPARRTTAPGVAPFRQGFHETSSKIAALTGEELASMHDDDDAR